MPHSSDPISTLCEFAGFAALAILIIAAPLVLLAAPIAFASLALAEKQ